MSSVAEARVLVINKLWQPINVITVKKAMKKVRNVYEDGEPKARIIDCINNDFQSWTWQDWSALKPNPNYCPECHAIKYSERINDGKCLDCGHSVGEQTIQAVDKILRVPRIIQMTRYDRLPNQKIRFNRRIIYRRDRNICQYCGCKPGTKELSLDHVIPRSKGGKTTWENIVLACTPCNTKKADRTLDQCGMKLLRQPTKPKYNLDLGDVRVRDWDSFISEAFWVMPLENDN